MSDQGEEEAGAELLLANLADNDRAYLAAIEGLVPATALQIVAALGKLNATLDRLGNQLVDAERVAVETSETYAREFDKAYLRFCAEDDRLGADSRNKAQARAETADMKLQAEVAKMDVRNLTTAIKLLQFRVEVGRTMAATVRSEHRTLGYAS